MLDWDLNVTNSVKKGAFWRNLFFCHVLQFTAFRIDEDAYTAKSTLFVYSRELHPMIGDRVRKRLNNACTLFHQLIDCIDTRIMRCGWFISRSIIYISDDSWAFTTIMCHYRTLKAVAPFVGFDILPVRKFTVALMVINVNEFHAPLTKQGHHYRRSL